MSLKENLSPLAAMILRHFGGEPALAMIGVWQPLAYTDDSLAFKWRARAKNRANAIQIRFDKEAGLYEVVFWRVSRTELVEISRRGCYPVDLRYLFEDQTGLALALAPMEVIQ